MTALDDLPYDAPLLCKKTSFYLFIITSSPMFPTVHCFVFLKIESVGAYFTVARKKKEQNETKLYKILH